MTTIDDTQPLTLGIAAAQPNTLSEHIMVLIARYPRTTGYLALASSAVWLLHEWRPLLRCW